MEFSVALSKRKHEVTTNIRILLGIALSMNHRLQHDHSKRGVLFLLFLVCFTAYKRSVSHKFNCFLYTLLDLHILIGAV